MVQKKKATKKAKEITEVKEEQDNFDAEMKREELQRKIRKLIKITIGSLFCVGGVWLIVLFWPHFLRIFKEWIGVFVILIGLFIILLGALD